MQKVNEHTLHPMPDGKRRLIDAALRLSAKGKSLSSLGLRELGREAGLNHNTFYRHFQNTDELGSIAAHEIARDVMLAMKEIRLNAEKHSDATVSAAKYFYDFVLQNPQLFIVCSRELHSSSNPMRATVKAVIHEISVESVDQIISLGLSPSLSNENLLKATSAITYYLFYRSLDYIENPLDREEILSETIFYIRTQFIGIATLEAMINAK